MLTTFSIFLAILAFSIYFACLLPLDFLNQYRKKLSLAAFLLGFGHFYSMLLAKNLNWLDPEIYQKCLPLISLFVCLTAVSYFSQELNSKLKSQFLIQKFLKSPK